MMPIDRRGFLKISSLAVVGAVGGRQLPAAAGHGASAASSGKQLPRWAMVIDIKKCIEARVLKPCVKNCHTVHNVPDFRDPEKPDKKDTKNEIKWLWTETYERVFPSQSHEHLVGKLGVAPVLTLCNHCENPPCVRVCPTKATFRREDGIVSMDPHRCIGCRFCIAACPYGSRSFNWKDPRLCKAWKDAEGNVKVPNPAYPTRTLGVVEKCNFCVERIVDGKYTTPPACVEAAGNSGAILFGDLNDPNSPVVKSLEAFFTIRRKPELGTEPAVYYIV